MLYAYAARFDVTENLKNFTNFLVTKQRLSLEVMIFCLYGVITCGVSNFSNILIVHAYNSKKKTRSIFSIMEPSVAQWKFSLPMLF